MYSDGDYVGGGAQRFYHPGNGAITVSGSTAYLTVRVSGGNLGDYFDLEFAAPPGQVLAPGVYDKAQRAPFREEGGRAAAASINSPAARRATRCRRFARRSAARRRR
jgi:hypothetical protein